MMDDILAFLIGLGLLVGMGIWMGSHGNAHATQAREALAACEKELPRNKVCEVVITARVKENTP